MSDTYIVCPRCHRHMRTDPARQDPSRTKTVGWLVTAFSLGILFACAVLLMLTAP